MANNQSHSFDNLPVSNPPQSLSLAKSQSVDDGGIGTVFVADPRNTGIVYVTDSTAVDNKDNAVVLAPGASIFVPSDEQTSNPRTFYAVADITGQRLNALEMNVDS